MAFVKGQKPPVRTAAAKKAAPARRPVAAKPKPLTADQKKKLVMFKAPEDFKPAFFEVKAVTQHDGLISPGVVIERIKGQWDNPEAKRFNLAEYDVPTLVGITSRLQASFYKANFHGRLPAKTRIGIVIRCSANRTTGLMSVSVKAAYTMVKNEATGKLKKKWFTDKTDLTYRKIRRAARLLRGAFVTVQLPPSPTRRKKDDIDGE